MKLRELLKKLRRRPLEGDGERPLDGKDDAAATFVAFGAGDTAPTELGSIPAGREAALLTMEVLL